MPSERVWADLKKGVRVHWSHEDQCWIAVDEARPGCCAVHTNRTKLRREMRDAQAAWDQAMEAATNITGSASTETKP